MRANEIVKDIMRYIEMRVREAEDIDWDIGYLDLLEQLGIDHTQIQTLDHFLKEDLEGQLREQSRGLSIAQCTYDILEDVEMECAELRREVMMEHTV